MKFLSLIARRTLHISTVLVVSLSLQSCSLINQWLNGEPAVENDAPAPSDYRKPIFTASTAPISPTSNSSLQITRIDASPEQNKVRVFVNLVDSNARQILQGGTSGQFKNMWCLVSENIDGEERVVKNFTVKEVKEQDNSENYAFALVLDHSGSMGDERAMLIQQAADDFVDMRRDKDQVCLVRYDCNANLDVPLGLSNADIKARNSKNGLANYGGGTAIITGAAMAVDFLRNAPKNLRKVVVLLTDGQENCSNIKREDLIRNARTNNTIICAVDFGGGTKQGFLESIAQETGGMYYHIYNRSDFTPLFADIYRRVRNYYVIEYPVEDFGKHTVKVKYCPPKMAALESNGAYDNTPDLGSYNELPVYFETAKADLKSESKKTVNNVAKLLNRFPEWFIELQGHTDNTGNAQANKDLSERRAIAVKNELQKSGISPNRITAKGFGDSQPVGDNVTEEGRQKNRRTIFILSK